jgi:hypothetical protein
MNEKKVEILKENQSINDFTIRQLKVEGKLVWFNSNVKMLQVIQSKNGKMNTFFKRKLYKMKSGKENAPRKEGKYKQE